MRLYFLRHAQSSNNELADRTGADVGRTEDPVLTAIGHRQAELLARFLVDGPGKADPPGMDGKDLRGFGLTHLYCSLMDRAIATGTYISRATGLQLVALEDAHESGGIYLDDNPEKRPLGRPGRNRHEFAAAYPDLLLPENLGEQGWWNRPFEEKADRPKRSKRLLDLLVERHGGTEDRVAIVSHGGFFNWFLMHIIGFTDSDRIWLHTNNASITRIDFYGGMSIIQYTNRTEHLSPELIT